MPRLKTFPACFKYLLLVAVAIVCAASLLIQPAAAQPATAATWDLSSGALAKPGKVKQSPTGPVINGVVVKSQAVARGQAPVDAGTFKVRYSIHEKAGKYILRGVWRITKAGATKAVHSTSDSIKGAIYAELPFNPITTAGTFQAKVSINPTRRHGSKTVKADGYFMGNEKFEGTITIW
jgi:hypothetical protein